MPDTTLADLKTMIDKAYDAGQVTRERASDSLVFYHVTQWDDNLLAETQLSVRFQFDQLRKGGRKILSDLEQNPVQVDFSPIDIDKGDDAEFADGLYRSDDLSNTSIEAYSHAKQESVVTGFGAWKLYTKYVTLRSGDKRQMICRKPLFEACNCIYWDPQARLLDKSDAKYVGVLYAYSGDGYKDLVRQFKGDDADTQAMPSFREPEQSYAFPWIGGESEKVYVAEIYIREKTTEKILTMRDPFGFEMDLSEYEINNRLEDMLSAGFTAVDTKKVERHRVKKYIASGLEILDVSDIAGEHIPIIPVYGEHAYVEGEEHYEGITQLAKDPQRLRNFMISYIADIVSRSPRNKPIFHPEQIKGFETMYQDSGADNNYPYLYMNRLAPDGSPLTPGPAGMMPEQTVPQSLHQLMQYAGEAISDVSDPGVPQNIADPDLSGKAVLALGARLDKQSAVYQEHFKHAKRRDAQVWASMAAQVYDTPRQVMVTLPDGTRQAAQVMQAVVDDESGEVSFLNDLRSTEFEITTRIGPDYGTQREQTVDRLIQLIQLYEPGDPMRKALQLKVLQNTEGVDMSDIREAARKQLIISGIQEPKTPEEEMLLQQHQQAGNEPSPEMILAMAEDKKGQADLMRETRETVELQTDTMNEIAKREIDAFKARTDRMNAQTNAQEADATIRNKDADTMEKRIQMISDEELMALAG